MFKQECDTCLYVHINDMLTITIYKIMENNVDYLHAIFTLAAIVYDILLCRDFLFSLLQILVSSLMSSWL